MIRRPARELVTFGLDLHYAGRAARRAPLVACTIVATVALGLGLVAVVFSLLNVFVFRADEVPNPHELFAVVRPPSAAGEPEPFTRSAYDALRRETAVFSGAAAMVPELDTRIDGRMMSATLVTGNFFEVVGVRAAIGRALTPPDDEAGGRAVVVLSHRGWSRHFASDPGAIGRTLQVNGRPFEILGVMPQGFRGLVVGAPDFWAPLSRLGEFRRVDAGRDGVSGIDIVGRLRPGLSRQQALAELLVWDSRGREGASGDRQAARLVLEPRQGTVPQPREALLAFTPLFFTFGLVLAIGCANVANLLLARGVARQREIGIRLALGASRGRIVRQLLTESLLLAAASGVLAFAVSRAVLGVTVYAVTSTMPPDLGNIDLAVPPADWRVVLFLVAAALVSTTFFALAPALHATRLEPVRAVRGEVVRGGPPGRARHALIALQVGASAVLLISSAVFLRSAMASATFDPGIRTADTVLIELVNEDTRAAMLDAVRRDPSVAAIAASWPDALGRPRAAVVSGGAGASPVGYRFVSPEYFGVLGVDILRGRGFTEGERTSAAAVAVVSESVARQVWPDRDAVGQVLRLEADPDPDTRRDGEPPLHSRTFLVVGVARDVAGFRFAGVEEAGVYVPIGGEAPRTSLTVRANGDPERARVALLDRLTRIDPGMGQVLTLRTVAGMESYFLGIAFWLTLLLGGLALLLTLSGLFSILSYLVEQRRREIGVRMALGATSRHIGALVVSQLARPVGAGLVAGAGFAAASGIVLLTTPAAAPIAPIVHLLDPVAYAASVLGIAGACAASALVPALRAGRIDPVATLRQD